MRGFEFAHATVTLNCNHLGAVDRTAATQPDHAIVRAASQKDAGFLDRSHSRIGDHAGERTDCHTGRCQQMFHPVEQPRTLHPRISHDQRALQPSRREHFGQFVQHSAADTDGARQVDRGH